MIASLFLYLHLLHYCSSHGDSNSVYNSSDYLEDYSRYLERFNKSMSRMNEPHEEIASMFHPTPSYHQDNDNSNINNYYNSNGIPTELMKLHVDAEVRSPQGSSVAVSVNWASTANVYGTSFINTIRNQV
eukprot:gene33259-43002_t